MQNPKLPTSTLIPFLKDPDPYVRQHAAQNPATPVTAVLALLQSRDRSLLHMLASNPDTPATLLAKLSQEDDFTMLGHLAQNPSTPPEVLDKLSKSVSFYFRRDVAANPNAYSQTLINLAAEGNFYIRCHLIFNPSTPVVVLKKLYDQEVAEDTLTERTAVTLIQKGLKLSPTEYCALIALYGSKLARVISQNVKISPNTLLAQQINHYHSDQKAALYEQNKGYNCKSSASASTRTL